MALACWRDVVAEPEVEAFALARVDEIAVDRAALLGSECVELGERFDVGPDIVHGLRCDQVEAVALDDAATARILAPGRKHRPDWSCALDSDDAGGCGHSLKVAARFSNSCRFS